MNDLDTLVTAFERRALTGRDLVCGLAALVTAGVVPAAAQSAPPIPARSLNHVSLAVADPEASKQFFQRTFGMPVASPQGTGINPALGTSFLGLHKMPNPGRVDHVCLGLDHDDVDGMAAKLEAQGIKATIRKDKPEVYFTDPDGIRFQLENTDYRG